MSVEDEALVLAVASELADKGPVSFTFRAQSAFELVGLVQLALRHPGVSDSLRRAGVTFVEHIRGYFSDCPAALDIIRRGDDREQDRATPFPTLLARARSLAKMGATHDCGEWLADGVCLVCGRAVH
jgi:hypothetical protein